MTMGICSHVVFPGSYFTGEPPEHCGEEAVEGEDFCAPHLVVAFPYLRDADD